jgi:hypothetical protein
LFVDPLGKVDIHNAPRLLGQPEADWMLLALVQVEFAHIFDAVVSS